MKFKCECGQTLATEDSAIGMTVECPTCKRRLKVPPANAPNIVVPPAAAVVPVDTPAAALRAPPPAEAPKPPQAPAQPPAPPPAPSQPPPAPQPMPAQAQPQQPSTRSTQATIALAEPRPVPQAEFTADLEEEADAAAVPVKPKDGASISDLWDFSLTKLITPSMIRYVYIVGLGLGALVSVWSILHSLWGFLFAKTVTFWGLLWTLVGSPIGLVVYVILLRVAVEFTIVVFNIERNTRAVAKGSGEEPKKEADGSV